MITLDAFKATVQDFIERQDGQALPRPGQLMLVGHAEDVGWKRLRIKPPYTWVAGSMVRGFIIKWEVDRLAIVLPGETPREFRVGFAERDGAAEPGGIADRRLAALVAAAHKEWSRERRPMRRVWGRPWPAAVLPLLLLFEVGPFAIWATKHGLIASPVSDAYYALIVVTAAAFWLQVRFSSALALFLAAVQVVSIAVRFAPLIQSRGFGAEAFWIALYLSYPAVILLFLWPLYADRAAARVDAGR